MKFSFNLKGKKESAARYAVVKGRTQDLPWDLYTAMLQSFPEGAFYAQSRERLQYVRDLIRAADPAFSARLAVYLRDELQLRNLAFILTAELCAANGDALWAAQLAGRVIHHAVEIPEWLDCYARTAGQDRLDAVTGFPVRLSSRLRRGLAPHFGRLDEYHFSRYSHGDQERLRHALALVRPAAAGKPVRVFFDRIIHEEIPVRSTWTAEWDTLQDQSYDSPALKQSVLREKYKEGISSFRMGYLGLLDNLQPILASGVSGKVLKLAAEYIAHPAAVAGSAPSPLRLLAAYRKLKGRREGGVPLLLEALEKAAGHSAAQIGIGSHERVVLALDVSNSMKQKIGEGSCIQRYDIGPLVALMLKDRCRTLTAGIIGNTWKPVDLTAPGILAGVDPFHRREGEAGYAINAHLVLLDLLKKKQVVDKVVIFTDSRLWDNRPLHQPEVPDLVRAWQLYRRLAPAASLCLFDLAPAFGKEPLEIHEDGVYLSAGWHDRIFDVIGAVENKDETLERINEIAL